MVRAHIADRIDGEQPYFPILYDCDQSSKEVRDLGTVEKVPHKASSKD
jgi:hypothetical protein